jgi:ABC-type branched-subunit amino acid transport system substrate-binding protein
LSLIVFFALAQDGNSFQSNFNNAKELLSLKKYGLAMQAFKPLTNAIEGNPYVKIASYYYAVCAYENGQKQVAKDMFLQIASKNMEWDKIDEVNLWLTNIYLQEGDYQKGLTYASKIDNVDARQSAVQLKQNYLIKMSYNELDSMLSVYPSDKDIAIKLADKIVKKPIFEQDRDLLENIVSVHELDRNKYRVEENIKSVRKDKYQVALLLPFMFDELRANPKYLSNEFVIQLYQGILIGVNDLKSQGINISLHLYDTKKEGATTSNILELEEMKYMDLIIGPLYAEPIKMVSEFAFEHKINMVNPLSSNSEIIGNNPYAFLYMPTHEVQAQKAADYISETVSNKNAFIFYGTNDRDSVLAYAYKQEIESQGFTVCYIEGVPTEEGKRILDILTNTITIEFDESEFDSLVVQDQVIGNLRITEKDYRVIQPDSIGHVFVASYDPALVANTITGLETRRDTILLVGLERWLEERVSLDGMNHLNTHLIAPGYIDKSNPKLQSINDLYKETFNAYPNKYFYTGYDVVATLGKLLKRSGNLFQFDPGINDFVPGEIFEGLLYGSGNSNQVVPIIKFVDAELQLVNPR